MALLFIGMPEAIVYFGKGEKGCSDDDGNSGKGGKKLVDHYSSQCAHEHDGNSD